MAGAFYQTDLNYCKGISFDGGGSDGNLNVFECQRETGVKQLEFIGGYTIGMRYSEIGQYTKSIRKEPGKNFFESEALVYPGKLMGLGSYGTVKEEWFPAFEKYYTGNYLIGTDDINANYKVLKTENQNPLK
jgi:predicted NodU family carbamoyl transferase